jgi:hypothetical protein
MAGLSINDMERGTNASGILSKNDKWPFSDGPGRRQNLAVTQLFPKLDLAHHLQLEGRTSHARTRPTGLCQ